jgi:hypothetical protein
MQLNRHLHRAARLERGSDLIPQRIEVFIRGQPVRGTRWSRRMNFGMSASLPRGCPYPQPYPRRLAPVRGPAVFYTEFDGRRPKRLVIKVLGE